MAHTNIYLENTYPILVKTTSGTTVYPLAIVTDDEGGVEQIPLDAFGSAGSGIYKGEFKPAVLGNHIVQIKLYDDSGYTTEVTDTRLCNICDCISSFSVILNPLDEIVSQHDDVGSLGSTLMEILSYLLLFERKGDGQCPVDFDISNGSGVAVVAYTMSGEDTGNRIRLGPTGRGTMYLNPGNYTFKLYGDCGKKVSPDTIVKRVDCSDPTVINKCTT